jgi:hypothetical protein
MSFLFGSDSKVVSKPETDQKVMKVTPRLALSLPQLQTKQPKRRTGRASRAVVLPREAGIRVNHVYRFDTTSGINASNITVGMIFGAIGTMGQVANSSVASFASSFRIKRLTIFESAQGVVTVGSEIFWASTTDVNTADIVYTNSTIPYDRPSCVSSTPPPKSLASFWWNSSATTTTPLFGLTCAIGSIIDLDVEFTIANSLEGLAGISVATATVGNVYYLALNGPATNTAIPVGLPTTH